MDTIFRGDLASPSGRRNAWLDSLLVDHALLRLTWTNFGVVVPGRLYRSNHPTPGRLAAQARGLGIRTVINLRGPCGNGSDALSREAADRLGIDFVDAPLRSRQAPPRARVESLLETYATMREPALVHCKSGADRAGFAAGLFLLAQGLGAREALAQMSVRRGHLPGSDAGVLRAFFLAYAEAQPVPFIRWLRESYDPAALQAGFAAGSVAGFIARNVLRRE